VEVVGDGGFVEFADRAFLSSDAACEVAEMVDRQWYVCEAGFANWFTVVPGFGDGEAIEVFFDSIGNFV
jgi:hypothetical protein